MRGAACGPLRSHRGTGPPPAEPAGGVADLKALASPLPEARFCPTGGIDAGRAKDYLALPNVICVGGSWIAPADALRSGDWASASQQV